MSRPEPRWKRSKQHDESNGSVLKKLELMDLTVTVDLLSIPSTTFERLVDSIRSGQFSDANFAADTLEATIRVAFAASLQTNEHRTCEFRIGWVQPEAAAPLLRFEAPLHFDVTQVRKLAAASGPSSMIGVNADGIWGLGHRNSNCQFFVDAIGPGSLKVGGWSQWPSLVVEPSGTTFLGEIGGLPIEKIATLLRAEHPLARRRLAISGAISSILVEMRRLGHGGTLIVLGRNWTDFDAHFSSWLSTSAPVTQVPDLIDAILDPPDWVRMSPNRQQHGAAARSGLEAILKSYAEFSSMDGAVVLDADLCLLGIGAKLSAKGDLRVECVWLSEPPETRTIPVEELGGTRHQSAARFVAHHRDAVAIVVSADGPVTAFVPLADGGVIALKRLDWLL